MTSPSWKRAGARKRGGCRIRAGPPNRIFGADRVREMLNVHLYFVKLFGCHIAGNNIPIDITGFSDAIMHGKLHPRVYLKFGCGRIFDGKPLVGMTDMWITPPPVGGCSTYATWFYDLDFVGINVCTPRPARRAGWCVASPAGRDKTYDGGLPRGQRSGLNTIRMAAPNGAGPCLFFG
jgi:hypothetical protein